MSLPDSSLCITVLNLFCIFQTSTQRTTGHGTAWGRRTRSSRCTSTLSTTTEGLRHSGVIRSCCYCCCCCRCCCLLRGVVSSSCGACSAYCSARVCHACATLGQLFLLDDDSGGKIPRITHNFSSKRILAPVFAPSPHTHYRTFRRSYMYPEYIRSIVEYPSPLKGLCGVLRLRFGTPTPRTNGSMCYGVVRQSWS